MDKEVVVHIHNGILLSHKKEHISVSSNEVDEPRAYYQSEVSQKEKNKYHILMHIYNLERWYQKIYLQGNNGQTDIENRLMDMGRREERVRYMERE